MIWEALSSDLIAADPFLFQELKLSLQLRLPLHLLLSSAYEHSLAVEFSAVHVFYSLKTQPELVEGISNR